RDVGRVGADLAGDLEQALGRGIDVSDRLDEDGQEAGDDQRGDKADDEADDPRGVRAHLPTATFLRARAECRMRTPESLIREMLLSSVVCWRTVSSAGTAVLACVAIRWANRTIVMTIAAATRMTTTPRAIPTYQ